MLIAVTVAASAGTMLVLAVAMSLILGWASRAFHVEVDPRIEAIDGALPGANCGNCGFVGCGEYAEAVVTKGAAVDLCPVGGTSCAATLATIMGVEVGERTPRRPVVHCAADRSQRLAIRDYLGEQTCAAANVISGLQGCVYGCLGLEDCVVACDYDAIQIVKGLAVVDYQRCIGCGACARACPRNIITMVPFKTEQVLVVKCSNKDFGKEVSEVCKVGCIGCKSCVRLMGELFTVEHNLPMIDYDSYTGDEDFEPVLEKCPMESLVFVGRPTEKDRAAVEHEQLPDRVEADFKTSADRAEWRG